MITRMDRVELIAAKSAREAYRAADEAYRAGFADGYASAFTQLESAILAGEDPLRFLVRVLKPAERVR